MNAVPKKIITSLLRTSAIGLTLASPAYGQTDAGSTEAPPAEGAVSDTAAPGEASASAANEAADASGQVADIVVTARQRAEILQNVPDTITAFSEQTIDERRLDQISDFLELTPNVNITADQDAGTNNISIRGLGSNRNQSAAIAFSVDGVILPDADAFTMDLSDAERVEVLKGPQGALYGKGAIAGAINITSKRPTNQLEAEGKLSYETGNSFRGFASVSGPLVTDKLLARATVSYRNGDGTIENRFDGRDLNPIDQIKVSGRLIAQPAPGVELDVRGSYFDEKTGSLYFSLFDVLGTTGGRIREDVAGRQPNLDGPSRSTRSVVDFSVLGNVDTPIGTLTSITAYDKIKVDFNEDLDISPFPLVPDAHQNRQTRGISQEFRLTSSSDRRLRYIFGVYYQDTKRDVLTDATLDICLFIGACFGPDGFQSFGTVSPQLGDYGVRLKQYSAFTQLNYDITPQVELSGALRYDTVRGKLSDDLAGISEKAKWSKLQPKVTVAYRPTTDLNLYAIYSQGFKAGSFNQVAAGPGFPRVVKNETSTNYEVGLKTAFLDRRVRVNLAAFYTRHNNPQIFQLDPATVGQGTLNARKAAIKGFEFELSARPTRLWDINAAFGYIDAEIRDFNGVDDAYVGQQLPNAPKYTLNLGTGYRIPLPRGLEARMRVDYRQVGKESFQDFQFPADPDVFLYQNAVSTVDAQVALEHERWVITAFARNLFDRRYATSAFSRYIFPVALVPLNGDAIQPDPGRIFGVEARIRY
ncbi:MAG TPA: TonB-dependent receptor [Sphingomicrobium sp.]|nr:TonB-dependent receptor [Sphingomicrobium sp.]